MPDFFQQHRDPQVPPLYSFQNVTIYSFRLTATRDALEALCDSRLNNGGGFEYRPIKGMLFVDLEILDYPRIMTKNENCNLSCLTQRECYFRVFVARYDRNDGLRVPAELSVFIPYVFVNNAWSVISGGEIIGLPNVMSSLSLPNSETGRLYPMRVITDVFHEQSAMSAESVSPIVEIDNSQAGPYIDEVPKGTIWPWGVFNPKDIDPALLPFLQDRSKFSTVQLKQFRRGKQQESPCYQALTHADVSIDRIELLKTLPAAEISVPRSDSLPIGQELGLEGETLYPVWQYTVNCDLKYRNVRNLFVNT